MNQYCVGAAVAIALASISSAGFAQAPELKAKELPGKSDAPVGFGEPGKAEKKQQPSPAARGEGQRSQETPKGAQIRPDGAKQGEPKAVQGRDNATGKSSGQEQGKDRPKAAEQPSKQQPKAAEQPGKDTQKSTERPARTEQPKSSQGAPAEKQAAPSQQGSRVRVSEEQRSGARDRLLEGRVEKVSRSRINISLNVGTAMPRSIRLFPLAATVFEVAPAYRGYSYVVLDDDTILIVDSRSYVIVDVIPASSARADRPHRAQLALSQDQMRFVYQSVPKDRQVDVRVRLALGAEVPRDVELMAFRDDVIRRVPELERYRFIVTGNDVAIIDPQDHSVALVISE